MRRSSLIILFVLLLSLTAPTLAVNASAPGSPAPAANPAQSIIDKYRTLIAQEMAKQNIPGMAIAIVDDNQVVWSEGFGFTDFDHQTPVTADTPFSIQSMSKSFTAAAVMLAVQDGLVDTEHAGEYIPAGLPPKQHFRGAPEDKDHARHLLSHTAGFTHDAPIGSNNDLNGYNWQEHIASIANTWLLFPVGNHYSYSNDGIDLAAHIVEVRAGMPFQQYVKTRLLDSLGMAHTFLDVDTIRAMPDRAIGHRPFSSRRRSPDHGCRRGLYLGQRPGPLPNVLPEPGGRKPQRRW